MEAWRKVWRDGLAPLLSGEALAALEAALRSDDTALIQGRTVDPLPLLSNHARSCEGACLIGYAGWAGEGMRTVGQVEEFFARMCFEVDARLGEPAGCRWLLNWWDETPRAEAVVALLPEVELELIRRRGDGRGE